MSKLIERVDYAKIRELAKKYNMSVGEFGRAIVRQSERSTGRAVRLTESEYRYIKETAKQKNLSIARFCSLACHAFLETKNRSIPIEERMDDQENRTKRIEARLYNSSDEIELIKISTEYSMKISALIRYCAIRFDGEKIKL